MSVIRVGAVKIAGNSESHYGSGDDSAISYSDADVVDIPLPEHTYQRPLPQTSSILHNSTGYFGLPYQTNIPLDQDHNYGLPPPPSPPRPATPSPPPSPLQVNGVVQMEEEVKTTPCLPVSVVEEVVEDSVTRCICGYLHDDGYMICCDKCSVWQHIDCMGVDRNNIPDSYFCEQCQPRVLDAVQAKALQKRKREELAARNVLSDSSATDTDPEEASNALASMGKKLPAGKKKALKQKRSLKVKEKSPVKVGKGVVQSKKMKKAVKKEKENIKTTKPRKIFKTASQKLKSNKSPSRALLSLDQVQGDPWNSSLSPWTDSYDHAFENVYSSGVRDYISSSHHLDQRLDLTAAMKEHLKAQLTCVADVKKDRKGLETTQDIPAGQAIIEYKGRVTLRSEYDDSFKVLQPFLLFYSKFTVELCVDAKTYGNQARFIRRSCFPNAEIQHWFSQGDIVFIVMAKEDIPKQAEVTIPFDYNYKHCNFCVECACIKNNCVVSRHWKKLKNSHKTPPKDDVPPVKKRRQSSSSDKKSTVKTMGSPKAGSPTKGSSSPNKSPHRTAPSAAMSPPPKVQSPFKFSNVSTLLAASAVLDGQLDVANSLNFNMVDALQRSPPPPSSPRSKSATASRRASRALVIDECPIKEEKPLMPNNGVGSAKEKGGKGKHKDKDSKDHQVEVKKERRLSRRLSQDESEPVNVVTPDPVDQPVHSTSEPEETSATVNECPKKKTREERKMDAIMKAFEKMEKRAEKKKEASSRSEAQKKSTDVKPPKIEEAESGQPGNSSQSQATPQDDPSQKNSGDDTAVKSEPKDVMSSPEAGDNKDKGTKEVKQETGTSRSDGSGSEEVSSQKGAPVSSAPPAGGTDQVKEETTSKPTAVSTSKPVRRTGKRKRRRSRAQSSTASVPSDTASVSNDESNSNSGFPVAPLSVPSTPLATPSSTPLPPSAESSDSMDSSVFKFKTKKHLFVEWSNKQPDPENGATNSKNQEEEMFVQCLPSPHVNNMDHLQRRNSHSSGCNKTTESNVGSAKKRWLRQAMHEVPAPVVFRHSISVSTELEHTSPAPGGGSSPNPGHPGQNSPRAGSPLDFQTPLKKRRLMRESLSGEVNGFLSSPSAGVLAENYAANSVATIGPRTNGVKQFFPAHRHSTDDRLLLHKNYPYQNGFVEEHPKEPTLPSPPVARTVQDSPIKPPNGPRNGINSFTQPSAKLPIKLRNLFNNGMEVSNGEREEAREPGPVLPVVRTSENGLGQSLPVRTVENVVGLLTPSTSSPTVVNGASSSTRSPTMVVVTNGPVYNRVNSSLVESSSEASCVTAKSIMDEDSPAIVRVDLNAHEMEPSSNTGTPTAVVNLNDAEVPANRVSLGQSLFRLSTAAPGTSSVATASSSRMGERTGECLVNSSEDVLRSGPTVASVCDNTEGLDSSVIRVNIESPPTRQNSVLNLGRESVAAEEEDSVVDSSQHAHRSRIVGASVEEEASCVQGSDNSSSSSQVAESSSSRVVVGHSSCSSDQVEVGQSNGDNSLVGEVGQSVGVVNSLVGQSSCSNDQVEIGQSSVQGEVDQSGSSSRTEISQSSSSSRTEISQSSSSSRTEISQSSSSENISHDVDAGQCNDGIDSSGQEAMDSVSAEAPPPSVCDSVVEGEGSLNSDGRRNEEEMDTTETNCDSGSALAGPSGGHTRRARLSSEDGATCDSAGATIQAVSAGWNQEERGDEESAVSESHQMARVSDCNNSADGNVDSTCGEPALSNSSTVVSVQQVSGEACGSCDSNFERQAVHGGSASLLGSEDSSQEGLGVSSSSAPRPHNTLSMDWDSDSASGGENVISSASSRPSSQLWTGSRVHSSGPSPSTVQSSTAPVAPSSGEEDRLMTSSRETDRIESSSPLNNAAGSSSSVISYNRADTNASTPFLNEAQARSNSIPSFSSSSSFSSSVIESPSLGVGSTAGPSKEWRLSSAASSSEAHSSASTSLQVPISVCPSTGGLNGPLLSPGSAGALHSPSASSSSITSSAEAVPAATAAAAKKKVSLLEYRKRLKEKPAASSDSRTAGHASSSLLCPSSSLLSSSSSAFLSSSSLSSLQSRTASLLSSTSALAIPKATSKSSSHSSSSSVFSSPGSSSLVITKDPSRGSHLSLSSSVFSPSRTSPSSSSSSPSRSLISSPSHHKKQSMPTLATLPLFKSSEPPKKEKQKTHHKKRSEKHLSLSDRLRLEFGLDDCGDDSSRKKDSEKSEAASSKKDADDAPPPPPPPLSTAITATYPRNTSQGSGSSRAPLVNGGPSSSSSYSYHHRRQQQQQQQLAGISSTTSSSSGPSPLLGTTERTYPQSYGTAFRQQSSSSSSSSPSSSSMPPHPFQSSWQTGGPSMVPPPSSSSGHSRPPSQHPPLHNSHRTPMAPPPSTHSNHRPSHLCGGGMEDPPPPPPPPLPPPHQRPHKSVSSSSSSSLSSSSLSSSHRHHHHHHSHHSSNGKSKSKAAASTSSRWSK